MYGHRQFASVGMQDCDIVLMAKESFLVTPIRLLWLASTVRLNCISAEKRREWSHESLGCSMMQQQARADLGAQLIISPVGVLAFCRRVQRS